MAIRETILHRLHEALPSLRERYAIDTLSLFGSVARGDDGPDSDVDLAVSFRETPDLWAFIDLKDDLAAIVGRRVDLVSRRALKTHVLKRVLAEEIRL